MPDDTDYTQAPMHAPPWDGEPDATPPNPKVAALGLLVGPGAASQRAKANWKRLSTAVKTIGALARAKKKLGPNAQVGQMVGSGGRGAVHAFGQGGNLGDLIVKTSKQDDGPGMLQEALNAARFDHKHVARAAALGWVEIGGDKSIGMIVPNHGDTLSAYIGKRRAELKSNALTPMQYVKRIARIWGQVLLGLDHIHQAGYIHCDIKGDNILVNKDGDVVIIDFGSLTVNGHVNGANGNDMGITPSFFPPWLRDPAINAPVGPYIKFGAEISPKVDLFALGQTLFHVHTGKHRTSAKEPLTEIGTYAHNGDLTEFRNGLMCITSGGANDDDNARRWWAPGNNPVFETATDALSHSFLNNNAP